MSGDANESVLSMGSMIKYSKINESLLEIMNKYTIRQETQNNNASKIITNK